MLDMRDVVVGPGLASRNYVKPDSQTREEPLSVPPNLPKRRAITPLLDLLDTSKA